MDCHEALNIGRGTTCVSSPQELSNISLKSRHLSMPPLAWESKLNFPSIARPVVSHEARTVSVSTRVARSDWDEPLSNVNRNWLSLSIPSCCRTVFSYWGTLCFWCFRASYASDWYVFEWWQELDLTAHSFMLANSVFISSTCFLLTLSSCKQRLNIPMETFTTWLTFVVVSIAGGINRAWNWWIFETCKIPLYAWKLINCWQYDCAAGDDPKKR